MSTPKTRNVTGTLFNVKGEPTSGTVQFMSPHNVSHNASDDIMVVSARSVIAGPDGEFEIPIPSSNDPAWSPSSWTWQIKLKTEDHTLVWNAVVPYSSVLDDIALNELAPVPAANGTLYALINHTHSGFVTEAEMEDAIQSALEGIGAAGVTSVNGQTGVVVLNASNVGAVGTAGGTMTGDLVVRDGGNTKGYRLRASGGVLDLEFGGAELWLGGKPGAPGDPFAGTQYRLLILRPNGSGVTAEGPWDFTGTVTGIDKTDVGLSNVDNTSDAGKPVSTAQATAISTAVGAIDLTPYAPKASPTFTGTVSGVSKTMVGLGNVDNTADTAKPVSTVQQTALNAKADVASPTFTGTVSGITKAMVGLGSADNTADTTKPVSTPQQTALNAKAPIASPAFTGTVTGITAAMVGLGNADNTADTNKPVSTLQAAAIAAMVDPSELATALSSYATTAALTTGLSGKLDALTSYLDAMYGNVGPIDHGLVGWTFDPYAGVQGGIIMATAGLAYTARIRVLRSTITNINLHFTVAGSGLTAGSCFAAVYSDAGTLLGTTVDQATNWATSGYKTCTLSSPITGLTPYTWVRVVWWFNGTTGPTLSRAINSNTAITNANMSSNFRSATANTGLTTGAPGTLGSLTGFLTGWWVGLS